MDRVLQKHSKSGCSVRGYNAIALPVAIGEGEKLPYHIDRGALQEIDNIPLGVWLEIFFHP